VLLLLLLLLPETMKVLQARRLLELKAALSSRQDTKECLNGWVASSYPCDGPKGNSDWLTPDDEPMDEAVVTLYCSDDGIVTSLQLECSGLSGTLPASIGRLPGLGGLEYLGVEVMSLTGNLPPEWGSGPGLVGLRGLRLDLFLPDEGGAARRGGLPPEWGDGPGLALLEVLRIGWWPGGSSVPCSWAKLEKLESLEFEVGPYLGMPNGCLPSPQLQSIMRMGVNDGSKWLYVDDAEWERREATLRGVRGEG
jgi:hypothetical protein